MAYRYGTYFLPNRFLNITADPATRIEDLPIANRSMADYLEAWLDRTHHIEIREPRVGYFRSVYFETMLNMAAKIQACRYQDGDTHQRAS